jgi:hypothetical protein
LPPTGDGADKALPDRPPPTGPSLLLLLGEGVPGLDCWPPPTLELLLGSPLHCVSSIFSTLPASVLMTTPPLRPEAADPPTAIGKFPRFHYTFQLHNLSGWGESQ